jgi:hypothetical protein
MAGSETLKSTLTHLYPHVFEEKFEEFFDNSGNVLDWAWQAALAQVDRSKTPGSPLNALAGTNDLIITQYELELRELVNHRIAKYILLGEAVQRGAINITNLGPDDDVRFATFLFEEGYSDAVLVGWKGEPRKIDKDPRLVAQVSLIMNLAARFISGDFLRQEQTYKDIPTATQLDIITDDERDRLQQKFETNFPLFKSDMQGYEFSQKPQNRLDYAIYEAHASGARDAFTGEIHRENHWHAILGRMVVNTWRVVRFGSGDLIVPPPGNMSSGDLATFSENSFTRAHLANDVSWEAEQRPVRFIQSAGDDAVDSMSDYRDLYEKRGFHVTDYGICDLAGKQHGEQITDGEISFCSTTFKRGGSYQENIEKTAYAMLQKGYDDQALASFDLCFKNHPKYPEALEFLRCMGYMTPFEGDGE